MLLPRASTALTFAARLSDLGYTVEGVRALLGGVASDALDRDATTPARLLLRDDHGQLAAAVRLLLLGESMLTDEVERALGPIGDLAGIVEPMGDRVGAVVEVAPYAVDDFDWLVASDWSTGRTGRPTASDHVLGVGGASTMLAQCTVRPAAERALDVGTGCGIQAFHLAQHVGEVVATDISDRCLALAEFNFSMNQVAGDLRSGSLFEPVADERFDLIVSNPPFVIASPPTERHDYRDSGLPGDELCGRLVRGAAKHLAPGGWCQLLANWEIVDGDDWPTSPRSWLADTSLDAWVLQRDVQDPAAYVETWSRDAGDHRRPDYEQRYEQWLVGLRDRGVVGVGFGLITLRAGQHDEPIRKFQHAAQPLAQPVGPDIERWFQAQDELERQPRAAVLMLSLRCAADVNVVSVAAPGAEVAVLTVQRDTGLAWSGEIDPFGVDILAAADGSRPIADVIAEQALLRGLDPASTLAESVPVVRRLFAEGFLTVLGNDGGGR